MKEAEIVGSVAFSSVPSRRLGRVILSEAFQTFSKKLGSEKLILDRI